MAGSGRPDGDRATRPAALNESPRRPRLSASGPIVAAVLLGVATLAGGGPLKTDTGRALVPLDEIVEGGPPPDGIPAIDRPVFVTPGAAASWLTPKEPVLGLDVAGDARAYPLQILMWHEIVNDVVGGTGLVVTYCPLCNSGLAFERSVGGRTLDFGTSGKLYRSDLVMYDRQTHSLWSQMDGRAIVGELAGARLAIRPANTISFEEWRAARPHGKVLSRDTGHRRRYGVNPYEAYDRPLETPLLFSGRPDPRRPPKERVVGVRVGGVARAYPWSLLERRGAFHDRLGDETLVVLFQGGTLSALDARDMARSRAVGATGVYSRRLDDRVLTFVPDGARFRDQETGSTWTLLGGAVAGPLAGRRLRAIPHVDAFWFAWAAFNPATSLPSDQ